MKYKKGNYTLSGFLLALVIISMFMTGLGVFISGMNKEYSLNNATTLFNKYNQTNEIIKDIETIRNESKIEQDEGLLDVIGAYFTSGYKSIKISFSSFSLFEDLLDSAENDISFLRTYSIGTFLKTILLIILIVGILISVMVNRSV